jgi:hypothetical protein
MPLNWQQQKQEKKNIRHKNTEMDWQFFSQQLPLLAFS